MLGNITVVGLGPGSFGLITMESWELLQQAKTLLFRTAIHPTVEEIRRLFRRLRKTIKKTFDMLGFAIWRKWQ